MIYLNDNFEGGKTKFFRQDEEEGYILEAEGMDDLPSQLLVSPKLGKALVFNHDVWHEGEEILKGTKYILR